MIIRVEELKTASEFTEFISRHRNRDVERRIDVDFSHVKFVRPVELVALACLIEEYHQKGSEISFQIPKEDKANLYLQNIKFYKYWTQGFDRDRYTETTNRTHLCLWKINREMIDSFTTYAQEFFETNEFSGKDLTPLNISLTEVFNNIFDHSKSAIHGYVIVQYYELQRQIWLSICDFGIGVVQSVKNFTKNEVSSVNAIEMAFTYGFTTQSLPNNRGFGLPNLLDNVKSLKGRIVLTTNDLVYVNDFQGSEPYPQILKSNHDFRGTHIHVMLRTDHLPIKDRETLGDLVL